MDQESTKELERSVLHAYDRDGMLETLMGVALVIGGLNLIAGGGAVTGLLPIVIILMARAWKRRITYPRLGYAEIVSIRRKRRARTLLLVILAVFGVVGLAFAAALSGGAVKDAASFFAGPHAKLLFGAFLSAIMVGIGIVQKAPLLYALAVLLFALVVAADRMGFSGGYGLAVTGALMGIVGLARLSLFLRANPRLEGSAVHDE
jgi:hypothetical protein